MQRAIVCESKFHKLKWLAELCGEERNFFALCLFIGDSQSVPDTIVGSRQLSGAQPAAALESAIDDQLRNTH